MSGDRVIINEVGPRDGLQSQPVHLTVDQRQTLLECLLDAGIQHIEAGSFVSPKSVPQMADTGELIQRFSPSKQKKLSALVPNLKGYQLARAAGVDTVAIVVCATETMNQKNIRMSLAQTLVTARSIIECSKADDVRVQAYLAVAFECPFEGRVHQGGVEQLADELLNAGAAQLVIADTIGAANPGQVRSLMDSLVARHGDQALACHFHDTRAMALANVFAAIESGVRQFDAAIGGMGGCPFAPGAAGNVATEDVVMLCEQLGFSTGIDMASLLVAVNKTSDLLGKPLGGRALTWLRRQY